MNEATMPADDVALMNEAQASLSTLRQEINRVIVGQEDIVNSMLTAILSQGHVLIIGVPGLAKTLMVKTLAGALGWTFKRIQFTPDLMPSDIIGMELLQDDAEAGRRALRFVPGPVFANMILADEINRAPPKTQSALLEAMQEYNVTSMGHGYPIDLPFIVMATQNPIEQEGTYPLPEAQLDRFMFSLWVDYPSEEEELNIVAATTVGQSIDVSAVLSADRARTYQSLVHRVPTSAHVMAYAVLIARASRPREDSTSEYVKCYVEWGAGPRASQHMVLAAKAMAVLDGEPAVTTDHIRRAAPLVLRHRVIPSYAARSEGLQPEDLVAHMMKEVREPEYVFE